MVLQNCLVVDRPVRLPPFIYNGGKVYEGLGGGLEHTDFLIEQLSRTPDCATISSIGPSSQISSWMFIVHLGVFFKYRETSNQWVLDGFWSMFMLSFTTLPFIGTLPAVILESLQA